DGIIEAKLHFLLDVSGKVIGRDPTGVNVERGLARVRVPVNDLKLDRIPRRTVGRTDQAALPGGGNSIQLPFRTEREVDQLEVMDGDVGRGVAAGDPFGELAAADRLGFEERAVPVVDVLQHTVLVERSEFLVIGVRELVINDLRQNTAFG